MLTALDSYKGGSAQKAFTWMPKQCCDVNKHEIRRGVKITDSKTLEIIAFRLPSKSGLFQEDLYPPFPSNKPSSSAEEWMKGVDKPPITMELRPEKAGSTVGGKKAGGLAAKLAGKAAPKEEKKQSPEEM